MPGYDDLTPDIKRWLDEQYPAPKQAPPERQPGQAQQFYELTPNDPRAHLSPEEMQRFGIPPHPHEGWQQVPGVNELPPRRLPMPIPEQTRPQDMTKDRMSMRRSPFVAG